MACLTSFACSTAEVSPAPGSGDNGNDINIGDVGKGGAGGGTPTTPTATDNCGQKKYNLERQPAELLLVLDRSGSMKDAVMGVRKWDAVVSALDQVIMATEGGIFWGLKPFPSGNQNCGVDATVSPDLGLNNYRTISAAIRMTGPDGSGTPTKPAVDAAVKRLQGRATPNPKYIVLATDGQPTCGAGGGGGRNRNNQSVEADAAVASVKTAAAAGFDTFVIGIAAGMAADNTLSRMAVEGKQARTGNPKYYNVMSRDELVTALTEITGQVTNCAFPLSPPPPVPDNVAVNVGGMRVGQDAAHMNGWDYGAGMRSIQLYGAACDAVKSGQQKLVDIIYGCPGELIE